VLQLIYRDSHYVDKFSILGERHSGTNFLAQCVHQKFGLEYTEYFHNKHFFGFCKPETITYKGRNVIFFGIVRNPYDWIASFYNLPYHIPNVNSYSIEKFITNEWYSVDYENREILIDRNYAVNPHVRYKNIFEMRKYKNIYISQIMPVVAPKYVLFSYDTFLKNYDNYLNIIGNIFNLKKIGQPPALQQKNPYILSTEIKSIIDANIDWSVENSLGFYQK
jgi:hypothetical protein